MSSRVLTSYRDRDQKIAIQLLAAGHCVSVVGLSNYGKSELLRSLETPLAAGQYQALTRAPAIFVYVDCNRMLELSPRGFFEATLRAVLETLPASERDLRAKVEAQYAIVVKPPSDFAAPLAFNDALVALVEEDARRVILLLDEFDEVLTGIEPRILLNLRALRDKYGPDLSFVIASVISPSLEAVNDHVAEFAELFSDGRLFLQPLEDDELRQMAGDLFALASDSLDEAEAQYIIAQAGGHPGLIQALVRILLEVESGAPQLYQQRAFDLANNLVEHDRQIRFELGRLWDQLSADEQQRAITLANQGRLNEDDRRLLSQRGLLRPGVPAGQDVLFGQIFARFARRKGLMAGRAPSGVWVDTDSGEVRVDGFSIAILTDLEYRLLLLLYGRLDKLCDKYQLVEAVWGEEYIDEVDDARIEKLVSRLRAKLEEPPGTGRYLVTVRGRGYKLSSQPEEAA